MLASIRARLAKLERASGATALQYLGYDLQPNIDDLARIDKAEKQGQRIFVHERADQLDGWMTTSGLPRPWTLA